MPSKATLRPSRVIIDDYYPISFMEGQLRCRDAQPPYTLKFQAFDRDDDERRMVIPGGYDFSSIFKLQSAKWKDESRSGAYPARVAAFSMKNKPRTDLQKQALDFMLAQAGHPPSTQRMLCLATGKGKTFVFLSYAQARGFAFAVFVDQDEIGRQWRDEIAKHTDILPEEVYEVSGTESARALYSGKVDPSAYKAFIVSYRTLGAFVKGNGDDWDAAGELLKRMGVGTKAYDEAHVEWTSIVNLDTHSDVAETAKAHRG